MAKMPPIGRHFLFGRGAPAPTSRSDVFCRPNRPPYGGARAAGGGSRPQRGNPRRGFPLYPLLRFIEHKETPRGSAPGPRPLFCKKAGQKTFKRQSTSNPSPSPWRRVIQSVREADTLAAEWQLPREWERRVGPETSRGATTPSAFLWGSTPFLWARPKKWGGTGSTNVKSSRTKRRVPPTPNPQHYGHKRKKRV